MQDIHTIKYYSTIKEISNDSPSHVVTWMSLKIVMVNSEK